MDTWAQGLGPASLLSQAHQQEAGLEVEQTGHGVRIIWNASVGISGLTQLN